MSRTPLLSSTPVSPAASQSLSPQILVQMAGPLSGALSERRGAQAGGQTPTERETHAEKDIETDWSSLLDPSHIPTRETIKSSPLILWNPDRHKPASRPHDAMVVRNLFSREECARLIAAAEKQGFGVTPYDQSYRGNLRLMTTDTEMTAVVFDRIKKLLPKRVKESRQTWDLEGLNEKWRLAKYYPKTSFGRHVDYNFKRDDTEKSMYTVNVYMNDDYRDGRTRFWSASHGDIDFEVLPEAGSAVLFRQPPQEKIPHDGDAVAEGIKYLFRTDVMYKVNF